MAEWKEVWGNMEALGEEAKNLAGRERGNILGMGEELTNLLRELERMEKDIEAQGVNSPDPAFRDMFKGIVNRFHAVAASGPGAGMGRPASELLNRVWGCGIEAITSFLERKAEAVGVSSWTIGTSVGFPSGVVVTLS